MLSPRSPPALFLLCPRLWSAASLRPHRRALSDHRWNVHFGAKNGRQKTSGATGKPPRRTARRAHPPACRGQGYVAERHGEAQGQLQGCAVLQGARCGGPRCLEMPATTPDCADRHVGSAENQLAKPVRHTQGALCAGRCLGPPIPEVHRFDRLYVWERLCIQQSERRAAPEKSVVGCAAGRRSAQRTHNGQHQR